MNNIKPFDHPNDFPWWDIKTYIFILLYMLYNDNKER